ncbi:MAG: hypothetical protein ACJ8AT_13915 [Hyalangium sp.]|uniref:hypothetical protein n=1 Tax=Hyalangium sp. TaxID=2028555 RepID=UPI00389AC635
MPSSANIHQLEAEIAAWPLTSEAGFRLGLDTLTRTDAGVLGRDTQHLSNALLAHLRPRARGLSLEVLSQFRDGVWFGSGESPPGSRGLRISLASFAQSLAGHLLAFVGDHAVLRIEVRPSPEVLAARWRWLSFALPPDVLIAAHAAAEQTSPPTDFVNLGIPHLERFFETEGIAQTHLHLGAAVPFEWLWTHLMTRVGDHALQPKALQSEGSLPFGSAREFLDWLVTAAFARLILAGFLWRLELGLDSRFVSYVRAQARRGRNAEESQAALSALYRGARPQSFASLRPILRRLTGTAHPSSPAESLAELRRRDPVSEWIGGEGTLPETHLLTRGLRYLLGSAGSRDEEFSRVFWQYVRIRSLTYRHLVLEPGTAGLDWFSVHFRRISALRGGMSERALMASALMLESRGPPLKSIEVRTSPSPHWQDIRDLVRHIERAPEPPGVRAERGLVLHFTKVRNTRRSDHLPHADPRQIAHLCRFGSYFHEKQREALAIEAALQHHPELLIVLRGLDVCSLELAVPTWVFLPILQRLREQSARIARRLAPYGRVPPPFHLTLHAGEDFRRLIEGLRRIHEPIEFGILRGDDRIGHAVALGVDPEQWAASIPLVRQPAEERLDDLLWELGRYRRAEMPADAARVEYVRGQIDHLAEQIYGRNHFTPEVLLRARELRHKPRFLASLGYPFMRPSLGVHDEDLAGKLVLRYLTDFEVYAKGQAPLEIETHPSEVPMLHQAQRFLRTLLARLGITIEANPSSNILIGDLPLDEHPVFRLQPLPGRPGEPGGPVAVCLGDDDPITFASSLPDEFYHLYHALIRHQVSSQDALAWLDQLRKNGVRARFTLPDSIRPAK